MRQRKAWETTDEFWEEVKDLLIRKGREEGKEYKRKPGGGGKPKDFRVALSAICDVLRTVMQWKALSGEYGSSSAVRRNEGSSY
ncbi:MAG: transposase [Treponema sp.]|jgi:transposase|nr:transposase [Treponema sp.]